MRAGRPVQALSGRRSAMGMGRGLRRGVQGRKNPVAAQQRTPRRDRSVDLSWKSAAHADNSPRGHDTHTSHGTPQFSGSSYATCDQSGKMVEGLARSVTFFGRCFRLCAHRGGARSRAWHDLRRKSHRLRVRASRGSMMLSRRGGLPTQRRSLTVKRHEFCRILQGYTHQPLEIIGAPNRVRTGVFAVRGRRPGPLDDGSGKTACAFGSYRPRDAARQTGKGRMGNPARRVKRLAP